MLRWKSIQRNFATIVFATAACSLASDQADAVEDHTFHNPSTLSSRIEPQDLERQEAIASIINQSLRSSAGWRSQTDQRVTETPPTQPSQSVANRRSASSRSSGKWVSQGTTEDSQAALKAPSAAMVEEAEKISAAKVKQKVDWLAPSMPLAEPTTTPTTPTKSVAADLDSDSPQSAKPLTVARNTSQPRAPQTKKLQTEAPAAQPTAGPKGAAETETVRSGSTQPTTISNLPPLTRQQRALRSKLRRVLAHYYNKPFDTATRGPWELMHAMLSFEVHSRVLQNGPNGDPITAVGWLCFNQPCRKRTLMYLNQEGDLRVRVGPALQGHEGQLLALLAQSRVKSSYPMKVEDKDLTIADLIKVEQLTCYPRTELTFKLIGLMHYLPSDATWLNDQGYEWNFPKLIDEEMRQPIRGAACGGTHRLSGLTLAVKKRRQRGEPVDGEYAKADRFVRNYQNYAYRLQNPDGSFSTEWFRGPGNEDDIDRKLQTTGHILEWILYAADEDQLNYWRTVKAVNFLTNLMSANANRDWEAGPLGHALHALVLYDRLVFEKYDQSPELNPTERQTPVARSRANASR